MISLILDIIVLLCLGATIFYAMRLSTALNNFKAHRKEFEGLMADLSQNIAQAQAAMTGMKAASKKTSADLQEKISDAVALCDELQLMTEMGNRLAQRLEEKSDQSSGKRAKDIPANNEPASKMPDADLPSFFIKDPEFNEDSNVQPFSPRDGEDEDGDGAHLQSEAERELFKALKRKK